jgi:hypothetical protein
MKSTGRTLAVAVLVVGVPLSIFVACGSSTFTSADQDAQTVNPLNDANSGDSQTTSDASVDDAGPTWCQLNAPKAYFCADFDEGDFSKAYYKGVLEIAFSTVTIIDGGVPGAQLSEDTSGNSPPGSLHAFVPTLDASLDEERATASTPSVNAPGATGFQLDFDVRNDADDVTPNVGGVVAKVELSDPTVDGGMRPDVYFTLSGNVTEFVNFESFTQLGPYPSPGVWTHLSMVVVLGGDATVELFDGGNLDVGSSYTTNKMSAVKITLGEDCTPVAAPPYCGQNLSFDNVVIHAYGTGNGG